MHQHLHSHQLLRVNAVGFVENHPNFLMTVSLSHVSGANLVVSFEGYNCTLEFIADIKLMSIEEQQDKVGLL